MSKSRAEVRLNRYVGDLDKSTKVLEIGALHRPTLNPRDFNIKFADFTDTETLRKNYASMPGYNTDDIVNVDYIIGDGDYQSVFKQDKFDLVLGSHVGEHMPDFVG